MRILLVCTVGGHLAQLHELSRRFVQDGDEVLWVTHDTSQSASLLAGETVEWLPYIGERDVAGVLRTVPAARRLLRGFRPDLVVSTGSAIAVAFLPLARLSAVKSVFIESAAMSDGHTRTGRLLSLVPGIGLCTQSRATARGRWQFVGSVFDGFTATRHGTERRPRRIVVTVGTSTEFGFRSLIERVSSIVPGDVEVVWQTGSTDVSGLDIDATPWLPAADLESAMAEADAVITHAGAGSALAALMNGHRPILVPRRSDHVEFNDDHQMEIVARLEGSGVATRGHVDTLAWTDVVEAAQWSVERAERQLPLQIRPRQE